MLIINAQVQTKATVLSNGIIKVSVLIINAQVQTKAKTCSDSWALVSVLIINAQVQTREQAFVFQDRICLGAHYKCTSPDDKTDEAFNAVNVSVLIINAQVQTTRQSYYWGLVVVSVLIINAQVQTNLTIPKPSKEESLGAHYKCTSPDMK